MSDYINYENITVAVYKQFFRDYNVIGWSNWSKQRCIDEFKKFDLNRDRKHREILDYASRADDDKSQRRKEKTLKNEQRIKIMETEINKLNASVQEQYKIIQDQKLLINEANKKTDKITDMIDLLSLIKNNYQLSPSIIKKIDSLTKQCNICTDNNDTYITCSICSKDICNTCFSKLDICPFCRNKYNTHIQYSIDSNSDTDSDTDDSDSDLTGNICMTTFGFYPST